MTDIDKLEKEFQKRFKSHLDSSGEYHIYIGSESYKELWSWFEGVLMEQRHGMVKEIIEHLGPYTPESWHHIESLVNWIKAKYLGS